jgi:two-component system C4-dicarboxylate transport sensor histidine kinase DctB
MGGVLAAVLSNRTKLLLAVLAALVGVALIAWPLTARVYMDQTATRAETTLRLAVAGLEGQMRRFEPLPALISDRAEIRQLMTDSQNTQLRATANGYLKSINALVGSSDIYVIAPGGETVAASNFDTALTFVGENFSYRPYYQDAIAGGSGRFFALGTTSLKRGYYFSAPIVDDGSILGVTVFKVDLDQIEASWTGGDYEIVVHDPEGIIFMTSRPDWLYSSLLPLTPERIARTEASRRYAERPLRELPIHASVASGRDLLRIGTGGQQQEYLVQAVDMPDAGWRVVVLSNTRSVYGQVWTSVAAAMLLVALAGLAGAILLQRRARLAERLELQRAAQEELEHRVEARTADLAEVNQQLEAEVTERRATEQQLRRTQSDLIQAGKLAALGQMSAALSHEFNQPLAALKAYAENSVTLIDRERTGDARDNLTRISSLADRMSSISRHLRNFAREPNQSLGAVSVAEVMKDTLEIVTPRLKSARATVDAKIAPEIVVTAGAVRLQQVLVNLISNAADAIETGEDRRIHVSAISNAGKVIISVRDHGPGVPEAIRERIFDPFYSTKGVGKGLGLGLSISYNIVKDFGGELSVSNHPDGGAVFSITLDSANASRREAAE